MIKLKDLLPSSWIEQLKLHLDEQKFISFLDELDNLYETETIYPSKEDVFKAYKLCSFEDTKLIILGQDPYHDGSADGLCFSNKNKHLSNINNLDSNFKIVNLSPSLKNIFKELEIEYNIKRINPNLEDIAIQGVLLTNTILTVKEHTPLSFENSFWKEFSNAVIKSLNNKNTPVVFLLLGNHAIKFKKLITNPNHIIIKGVHPSPLSASRGFLNSGIFKETNRALENLGYPPIDFFKGNEDILNNLNELEMLFISSDENDNNKGNNNPSNK